jgi:hypothetical protein
VDVKQAPKGRAWARPNRTRPDAAPGKGPGQEPAFYLDKEKKVEYIMTECSVNNKIINLLKTNLYYKQLINIFIIT